LIDYAMSEAQHLYSGGKDLIFAISDMKEGFEKNYFDSL